MRKLAYVTALAVFYGSAAYADIKAGEALVMKGNGRGATACMACHGAAGEGQEASAFPRLAGLSKEYFVKQLKDFKSGVRKSAVMQPIAGALNDAEGVDAAEYYATMQPPGNAQIKVDAQTLALGQAIATQGNWSKGMPACFQCHGADAAGIAPVFPPLAAQHASYIVNQINNWKSGQRGDDPAGLMKSVATKLSDAETKAVAAYLTSLAPKPPQAFVRLLSVDEQAARAVATGEKSKQNDQTSKGAR